MDKLKEADHKIHSFEKLYSYKLFAPINKLSEQEKFFESEDYNPQFEYAIEPEKISEAIAELNDCKVDKEGVGRFLEQKKQELIVKLKMLLNVGDSHEFTELSKAAYSVPSTETLGKAKATLRETIHNLPNKNLSADEGVEMLKKAVANYEFHNWNVEAIDLVSNALVEQSEQLLYLAKDDMYSEDFIRRLAVHEIGTHILRAENGKMQPFQLFSRGFPNYNLTEEGLAAYHELLAGVSSQRDIRNYATRALAVTYGLEHSFRETFNYLVNLGLGKKMAFRITLRIKRGLKDTSEKGGLTKDHVYFSGFLAVKRFVKYGGKLEELYIGKIGVEHVKEVKQFDWLKKPKYYPKLTL